MLLSRHIHVPPLSNRGNMAASSPTERSPEISTLMKTPKTEVPWPESDDLSDSNQNHSDASTPNRFSPLNVGSGPASRTVVPSSSNSFTACRGMSWTPSETNALIAVWGNERLNEARMQQLEVAGTVFSGKAPGPAMYERVSRALTELGYERTPSQCRERMKVGLSHGHLRPTVIYSIFASVRLKSATCDGGRPVVDY